MSDQTEQLTRALISGLDALIAAAPEDGGAVAGGDAMPGGDISNSPRAWTPPPPPARNLSGRTQVPKRYRAEWPRPVDDVWVSRYRKVMARCRAGGIVAMIGPRGTGKTRLAAEAMRAMAPDTGSYTTAMGLFLRIRASFGQSARETEADVVAEMATAPLLVLDEIQERGNTAWEDRLLTHILDRRYGAMAPTIVIANLTEIELAECLGESIISRLTETGGILEINGVSYRNGGGA